MQKILKIIFLSIDLLLIILAFNLAWIIRFQDFVFIFNDNEINEYSGLLLGSLFFWAIISFVLDLMHVPRTKQKSSLNFWNYVFYPQLFFIINILFFLVFFNFDQIPRLFLMLFIIFEISFLIISKKIRHSISEYLRLSGYDLISLGIIGEDKSVDLLKNWINQNQNSDFKLINSEKNITCDKKYINLINNLQNGDYLILLKDDVSKKDRLNIIELTENKGIHLYNEISIDRYKFLKKRSFKGLSSIGPFKLVKAIRSTVKNPINVINKRIFDFIFSSIFVFFIYWWVYLFVSAIIKIQSKGPILFKQERIGLDGNRFTCLKFRTMHIDDSNSKKITTRGDKRIFAFGKFLRKSNIDEFPQFINVLRGDMSVVGPRPHMVSEDEELADKIDKYRIRRWVKPGITGYAAILGFRGGTESIELMQKRIDMDVKYIEKWSFWLDLKICYSTFYKMISFNSGGH